MSGIIQTLVITRQHFGQIPTYCKKCRKQISFKITNEDGSYTQKCDCGCRILSYHSPDENHQTAFFTSLFISAKQYDPDYKNKDNLEKLGFKKISEHFEEDESSFELTEDGYNQINPLRKPYIKITRYKK